MVLTNPLPRSRFQWTLGEIRGRDFGHRRNTPQHSFRADKKMSTAKPCDICTCTQPTTYSIIVPTEASAARASIPKRPKPPATAKSFVRHILLLSSLDNLFCRNNTS